MYAYVLLKIPFWSCFLNVLSGQKGIFFSIEYKTKHIFCCCFVFGGLELPFRVNLPKQCNKDENKPKITMNRIKGNRFPGIGYIHGNWTNQFTLHAMTNGKICNHINAKKWTENEETNQTKKEI